MMSVHLFSGLWKIPQHSCIDIICWSPWVMLYLYYIEIYYAISIFRIFENSTNLLLSSNWTYLDISEVGTWKESMNDHLTLNIFISKTYKLYRSNTNYITQEALQNVSKWCRYGYDSGFSRIMSPEAWATQAELYTMVLQYANCMVLDFHHLRHTHRMYFLIFWFTGAHGQGVSWSWRIRWWSRADITCWSSPLHINYIT